MAEHAYAAGDEPRAAHGWLLAGEDALRRAAVEDALGLLDRSLAVGTAFAGTRARALLARGAVHEARADFATALDDVRGALALARNTDDRRLEMAALRFLGGDAAVGLGLTVDELVAPAGARAPAGRGPRGPARRGRLHQPAGDPRGQPAAAGHGPRPGRGRAGAGAVGGLRGRAGAGARRPQDRVGLPRRPRPARRGDRRPRAPAPGPRRHLAAAVDGVREVVRARRRGPSGRRPCPGRRGAGAQPAQRLPGVRRLPARPRRLVRAAGRRPGRPRAGSAARPSRRARRSTTRGGTPSPPACSPPR